MRRAPWEGGLSSDAVDQKVSSERTSAGSERGVSSVLAVVLLMGIVVVGMVSIAVVGAVSIQQTKDSAEDQRVEYVFAELGQSLNSVALGEGSSERVNFDIRTRDGAIHHENTGHIKVYTEEQEIANQSFGSIEYVRDDTTFAYQAGGVWRGTGSDALMVSSPSFRYQDGTLNIPITVITGDDSLNSGNIAIRKNGTRSPINRIGYVQGHLVTVEITSRYYGGWAEYLRSSTNDVAVTVDHENETVIARLGQPTPDGPFSEGLYATGGSDGNLACGGGNPNIEGPVRTEGEVTDDSCVDDSDPEENSESNLRELDSVIATKVSNARNDSDTQTVNLDAGGTIGGGSTERYFHDGDLTLDSSSLNVDLSQGNVTLIVDGNISVDGEDISITGASGDSAFRIYSTGNFGMRNSDVGVYDEPQYLQIYGTSEMQVAVTGGNTRLDGTIYAPRDEPVLAPGESNAAALSNGAQCDGYDTCIAQGNTEVNGAIVGGPATVAQSGTLTYDTDLQNIEPELQLAHGLYPPPVTFMHVSVHEVAVDDGDDNQSLRAPAVLGGVDARARPAVRA